MSSPIYDAFVSYRRADLARVRVLVHALQAAGIRVYWDQMLQPGQTWAVELEQAIAHSRYTLVCITPVAVQSAFVEAEIKRSDGRLIPVLLEATTLPLVWEAFLGRIQQADLTASLLTADDQRFRQLCEVVSGRSTSHAIPSAQTLEQRARALIENSSVADRSLVVALALLGGAAVDDIGALARDFETRFRAQFSDVPTETASRIESLTGRLRRIGASVVDRTDPRYAISISSARFAEPALGHMVLGLAWSDYDALRAPISGWVNDWAADAPLWIRLRLALNLGILAQDARRFDAIWRMLLRPMLFHNAEHRTRQATERFEVADAALSIAALDAGRAATVKQILDDLIAEQMPVIQTRSERLRRGLADLASSTTPLRQTTPPADSPLASSEALSGTPGGATVPLASGPPPAQPPFPATSAGSTPAPMGQPDDHMVRDGLVSGNETERIRLVARLAFGRTGSRYPGLAVAALRRLVESGRIKTLIDILGGEFQDRMKNAQSAVDGDLWDPIAILNELLAWSASVPPADRGVPLAILSCGLDLPLKSKRSDDTSLTSILMTQRGLRALRAAFHQGLALPETREVFQARLQRWRDAQKADPVTPDPVLALVTALVETAPSGRDKERILFIVRHHYTAAQCADLAAREPTLCEDT